MTVPLLPLFVLLGAVAGGIHFAALSRDADLLVHGGSSWAMLGLRLGRIVLTVIILLAATRAGWPMLIAAAIGFMAARQAVLARRGARP